MNPRRNYYKILNVKSDVDNESIKKAYKRLVLKYHPDINQSEDAAKKFRLVTEAYNVLSDEEKRKEYDYKRAALIRKRAKIKKNELKIKEEKRNHRKRAGKSNISKYVKLAGDLERDYGIVSGALGLVFNNSSLKRRKGSGGNNSSALNIVSNLLSNKSSSHKGQYKHRYRGDRY